MNHLLFIKLAGPVKPEDPLITNEAAFGCQVGVNQRILRVSYLYASCDYD